MQAAEEAKGVQEPFLFLAVTDKSFLIPVRVPFTSTFSSASSVSDVLGDVSVTLVLVVNIEVSSSGRLL